jgi:prephenate dehydrogenase
VTGATTRQRVVIVGMGVMGGSLARALRALPDPPLVVGTARDPDDLALARQAGAVDEVVHEAERAVADADLVVYATPLRATLALLEAHREHWPEGAVVTDTVSLKVPVMEAVERLGFGRRFVGSHPLVGTEGRGFSGSRDRLYAGARVWMVPGDADPEVTRVVEGLWARVGARPLSTDAVEHDRAMAWCSHLPQLLSNALAGALDVAGYAPGALGSGGRDMVRLAASPPELWGELLAASGGAAAEGVRSVARGLEVLAGMLEAGDVDGVVRFMERTRCWKEE